MGLQDYGFCMAWENQMVNFRFNEKFGIHCTPNYNSTQTCYMNPTPQKALNSPIPRVFSREWSEWVREISIDLKSEG